MIGGGDWRVGQRVEPARRAEVQIGDGPGLWYVFLTRPMAEPRARGWFKRRGLESWYPTETVWRRGGRGVRRKVRYERRIAPGYLFVRFTGEPLWAAVRACRELRGVLGSGGRAAAISEEAMLAMTRVPDRLAELRRARAEARRVRVGDRARILDGPMSGWVVEVAEIDAGVARFFVPVLGRAGASAPVARLERLGLDR